MLQKCRKQRDLGNQSYKFKPLNNLKFNTQTNNNMIKKLLLSTLPIILFAVFTSEQMSDNGKAAKTGSPSEVFCTDCHGDFALNSGGGSATIQAPTMSGFQYTPGQTYAMSVTISRSASTLFGVGIEALTSANQNAGTLNITDAASTQIKSATAGGVSRRNIVHTLDGGATSASKVFNFSWTAPAAGTGNVTFYFCGAACNGNGNEGGDYCYSGSQLLTEISCITPVQPGAIAGATALCSGGTTTYSVAAVAGATTYTWTLPSGWSGTSTTNSINVTSSIASGNVTVTANNACGASPAATLSVSGSTYSIITSATSVTCNGGNNGSALATPSGGANPFNYSWSPSGGSAAAASNLTAGIYIVTTTDNTGCIATASITVNEPTALVASSGPAQSICGGGAVNLGGTPTASGGTSGYSYLWSPSTGLNDATLANPACTASVTTPYTVLVTDANGCSATSASVLVTVGVGTPATITLNGLVLETIIGNSYEWYFNGSYIPGSNAPTYTPTADGTYAVVVYFASGCFSVSPDFVYIASGINDAEKGLAIAAYPNPASTQLSFLINKSSENGSSSLVDVTGRVVLTQTLQSGINTMDVSTISKGAYFLTILNGEKTSSSRVFISR